MINENIDANFIGYLKKIEKAVEIVKFLILNAKSQWAKHLFLLLNSKTISGIKSVSVTTMIFQNV